MFFNDLDVKPANQVCPVKLLKIRYKKLVDNLLNQIKIKWFYLILEAN